MCKLQKNCKFTLTVNFQRDIASQRGSLTEGNKKNNNNLIFVSDGFSIVQFTILQFYNFTIADPGGGRGPAPLDPPLTSVTSARSGAGYSARNSCHYTSSFLLLLCSFLRRLSAAVCVANKIIIHITRPAVHSFRTSGKQVSQAHRYIAAAY